MVELYEKLTSEQVIPFRQTFIPFSFAVNTICANCDLQKN